MRYFYNLARRGQFEIWTSTLAYVEVFRLVSETNDQKPLAESGLDVIRDAIEQPFVQLIPVDMEIGREARRLRRELKDFHGAADAVHLASALIWSINPLHTWDKQHLIHLSGKLTCKDGSKLEIHRPDMPEAGPLFTKDEDQNAS